MLGQMCTDRLLLGIDNAGGKIFKQIEVLIYKTQIIFRGTHNSFIHFHY